MCDAPIVVILVVRHFAASQVRHESSGVCVEDTRRCCTNLGAESSGTGAGCVHGSVKTEREESVWQ